jgi:hypothetical protein
MNSIYKSPACVITFIYGHSVGHGVPEIPIAVSLHNLPKMPCNIALLEDDLALPAKDSLDVGKAFSNTHNK